MQYDGTLPDDVLIHDGTDPWVEVDGERVDFTTLDRPRTPCPCGEMGDVLVPGVIDNINTNYGVQRCDACDLYDGDLDAALALAEFLGGTAHFMPAA